MKRILISIPLLAGLAAALLAAAAPAAPPRAGTLPRGCRAETPPPQCNPPSKEEPLVLGTLIDIHGVPQAGQDFFPELTREGSSYPIHVGESLRVGDRIRAKEAPIVLDLSQIGMGRLRLAAGAEVVLNDGRTITGRRPPRTAMDIARYLVTVVHGEVSSFLTADHTPSIGKGIIGIPDYDPKRHPAGNRRAGTSNDVGTVQALSGGALGVVGANGKTTPVHRGDPIVLGGTLAAAANVRATLDLKGPAGVPDAANLIYVEPEPAHSIDVERNGRRVVVTIRPAS